MPLSAYIHIPFCKRKCSYCAFYSAPSPDGIIEAYVSALENNILHTEKKGAVLDSVYFGGGTPSLLKPDQYLRILNALEAVFDISGAEITTELNPESVSNLLDYRLIKRFTRFSMGVQSFDDSELNILGRLHNSREATDCYNKLRSFGANNINIDIMLALPGKDHFRNLNNTLDTVVSLSPEHVSAYILTPESGTPLFKRYNPVSDDITSKLYLTVCEKLEQAGYEHYEISNFAKKGYRCAHNMCYWNQRGYLAFGPSACGFDGVRRYRYSCSTEEYISENGLVEPVIEETLSESDLSREKKCCLCDFQTVPTVKRLKHLSPIKKKRNSYSFLFLARWR